MFGEILIAFSFIEINPSVLSNLPYELGEGLRVILQFCKFKKSIRAFLFPTGNTVSTVQSEPPSITRRLLIR